MLIHADLESLIGETKLTFSMLYFFSFFLVLLTIILIGVTVKSSSYSLSLIALLMFGMFWFIIRSKNRRKGAKMAEDAEKEVESLKKELGLKKP